MKLHRNKTNSLSKEHLQAALCFPVLHCAWIHSLYHSVWETGKESVAFLCGLWGFFGVFVCLVWVGLFSVETVVECFTSASVCPLKTSWISTCIGTFRKNDASSACCSYHLPPAQQIGQDFSFWASSEHFTPSFIPLSYRCVFSRNVFSNHVSKGSVFFVLTSVSCIHTFRSHLALYFGYQCSRNLWRHHRLQQETFSGLKSLVTKSARERRTV